MAFGGNAVPIPVGVTASRLQLNISEVLRSALLTSPDREASVRRDFDVALASQIRVPGDFQEAAASFCVCGAYHDSRNAEHEDEPAKQPRRMSRR
jgi:hypothetical protein